MAAPSPPRQLPSGEPELYGDDVLVEEEAFSWYDPHRFYPVRLGEVFEGRYQVLCKLGFGSVSTAWLCRDLVAHEYVTLKVYMTGHRQAANEANVLGHLNSINSSHPGSVLIRRLRASFELPGETGPHICLVHEPLGLPLAELREIAGGKIPESMLKPMIKMLLLGLDFLHSEAHVVHTDIQEGNFMLSIPDTSILDDVVREEWDNPSPRKVEGGRTIYTSVDMDIPDDPGRPLICDFGDAQVGKRLFEGEVMPDLYRAPEIILRIPWNEKIDIWGFGLMVWDLFEGKHLFNCRLPNREASSGAHLARMVSLLGPPPADLIARGKLSSEYFDEDGTLKLKPTGVDSASEGTALVRTTLEEEEAELEGAEKTSFLAFVRKMLQWRPEDRPSARELIEDPWLQTGSQE